MSAASSPAPARPGRRGSWLPLAVTAAVAVGGFLALRGQSAFARAEAEVEALRPLAARFRTDLAAVLALRTQHLGCDDVEFAARVQRFAGLVPELGEPLAAVALVAGDDAARALRTAAAGSPRGTDAAADPWPLLRAEPRALPGVEFELLRARFAARRSGRP